MGIPFLCSGVYRGEGREGATRGDKRHLGLYLWPAWVMCGLEGFSALQGVSRPRDAIVISLSAHEASTYSDDLLEGPLANVVWFVRQRFAIAPSCP